MFLKTKKLCELNNVNKMFLNYYCIYQLQTIFTYIVVFSHIVFDTTRVMVHEVRCKITRIIEYTNIFKCI